MCRAVLRGGYGMFFDKTHFELITAIITGGVFSDSFTAVFPANAADPGPSKGVLPTDPFLVGGPTVNRNLLDRLYPPGTPAKNTGDVCSTDFLVFTGLRAGAIPTTGQIGIRFGF